MRERKQRKMSGDVPFSEREAGEHQTTKGNAWIKAEISFKTSLFIFFLNTRISKF